MNAREPTELNIGINTRDIRNIFMQVGLFMIAVVYEKGLDLKYIY